MKYLVITLLLISCCFNSCAQKATKTKQFFDKIISEKPYNAILKYIKVIVKDVDLEDIKIEKYNLMRVYDNIDFNKDGKNDYILYIDRDVSEDDKFKVKEAFKYNYRILLVLIYQGDKQYFLYKKYNTVLNQNTEGLYNSSLSIFTYNDTLKIREFGRQIDTDWSTEMAFIYDKSINNWLLKKSVIYKANITAKEEKIIKPIKTYNIEEVITIDSASYYKYFPFGFSDDVY